MVQAHNTISAINDGLRPSWLLGLLIVLVAAPVYSQSLGEIARREMERKQDQPRHTTHVYDNDDLARPQILLPEDQERVHAPRKKTPPDTETARETDGRDKKQNAPSPSDVAQQNHAPETSPPQPKPQPRSLQQKRGAPLLGDSNPSRPPVRRGVPPVPPDIAGTRVEHAGNAIPHEAITGRDNIAGNRRVRVQPGDTLWGLASRYLGQGQDWLVLVAHNPQVPDPQRLQVGTWLNLPNAPPDPKPPERVRVNSGDSLWKVAQSRFGDGRGWICIAQANPQLHNAHVIVPGQILEIPRNCAATSLAGVRSPKASSGSPPRSTAELLRQSH